MEVGFCDAAGRGFYQVQPTSHLERWSLPFDNGTHLEIPWRPDRSACGRNVSSYFVDVQTSTPVLNLFIGVFGSFPQDLCDPRGSKAKNAVSLVDEGGTCPRPHRTRPRPHRASTLATARALALTGADSAPRVTRARPRRAGERAGERAPRPCHTADASPRLRPLRRCSPYTRACSSWSRMTAFEVPAALRQLTRLDVEITVRGFGSLSPVGRPAERTEVPGDQPSPNPHPTLTLTLTLTGQPNPTEPNPSTSAAASAAWQLQPQPSPSLSPSSHPRPALAPTRIFALVLALARC